MLVWAQVEIEHQSPKQSDSARLNPDPGRAQTREANEGGPLIGKRMASFRCLPDVILFGYACEAVSLCWVGFLLVDVRGPAL